MVEPARAGAGDAALPRWSAGLAGGIGDGQALALGCDLGYMGTRFIATAESMAQAKYKQMLVDGNADDVQLTRAFTGLRTNMLRPSIVAAGLDLDALPERDEIRNGWGTGMTMS